MWFAHVGQPFLTVGHNLALSVAFEVNDPINLHDATIFSPPKFSRRTSYIIYILSISIFLSTGNILWTGTILYSFRLQRPLLHPPVDFSSF